MCRKAGRPMGPSTLLCQPQSYQFFFQFVLFSLSLRNRTSVKVRALRKMYGCFGPSSLGPCSPWCGAPLSCFCFCLSFLFSPLFGFFLERKHRDNRLGGSPSSEESIALGRRTRPRRASPGSPVVGGGLDTASEHAVVDTSVEVFYATGAS